MMKVSVSKLDYFRLFMDKDEQERYFHNDEYISGLDMINNIKGITKQTKHGELGTAFHDIIQNPHQSFGAYCKASNNRSFGFLAENGIDFPFDSIKECYKSIDYDYPFEVPGNMLYEIGEDYITVTCRSDQLKLRIINDFKSIYREFDFEKFYNSYQWRLYLDIFGADFFFYHVFEFNDNTRKLVEITEPFYFLPYQGMRQDIHCLIDEFLYFVRKNNLEPYLKGNSNATN